MNNVDYIIVGVVELCSDAKDGVCIVQPDDVDYGVHCKLPHKYTFNLNGA